MSEQPTYTAPPTGKIAAALAAFQAEMPVVPKKHTATVKSDKGSYSYTYAGLADVVEAAMPLLAKNGLAFITLPEQGRLVGMLLHQSGESLTAALPINGATPQQIGSSLTYMRRYLLGCMTGLVTDDDEDGQIAEKAARKPRQQPVRGDKPTPGKPFPEKPRTEGGASEAQVRKMGALMGKLGMTDRALALQYVADVIGRQVGSRNELTSAEASRVIDALQKDIDGGEQS